MKFNWRRRARNSKLKIKTAKYHSRVVSMIHDLYISISFYAIRFYKFRKLEVSKSKNHIHFNFAMDIE